MLNITQKSKDVFSSIFPLSVIVEETAPEKNCLVLSPVIELNSNLSFCFSYTVGEPAPGFCLFMADADVDYSLVPLV